MAKIHQGLLKEKTLSILNSVPDGQDLELWEETMSIACDTANASVTTPKQLMHDASIFRNMMVHCAAWEDFNRAVALSL